MCSRKDCKGRKVGHVDSHACGVGVCGSMVIGGVQAGYLIRSAVLPHGLIIHGLICALNTAEKGLAEM